MMRMIDQVKERVGRLRSIPPRLKSSIFERVDCMPESKLAAYANGPLVLLETYVEPVTKSCNSCGPYAGLRGDARVGDPYPQIDNWLHAAVRSTTTPEACLHYTAGATALFLDFPNDAANEVMHVLLGGTLPFLGRADLAVSVLERLVGLRTSDYSSRSTVASRIQSKLGNV